jgi:hypothetical protein
MPPDEGFHRFGEIRGVQLNVALLVAGANESHFRLESEAIFAFFFIPKKKAGYHGRICAQGDAG